MPTASSKKTTEQKRIEELEKIVATQERELEAQKQKTCESLHAVN